MSTQILVYPTSGNQAAIIKRKTFVCAGSAALQDRQPDEKASHRGAWTAYVMWVLFVYFLTFNIAQGTQPSLQRFFLAHVVFQNCI